MFLIMSGEIVTQGFEFTTLHSTEGMSCLNLNRISFRP